MKSNLSLSKKPFDPLIKGHAAWLESLQGQVIMLTEVWLYDRYGGVHKDAHHKYLHIATRVHSVRSSDMILVALNGAKQGSHRYLDRPKLVEVVRDEFGFTINDRSNFNVKLTYKYLKDWKPQELT